MKTKLNEIEPGRVVLDNSGTALQKQQDGSWMYADTPLDVPIEALAPFTFLTHGDTPWSFPPEVEKVLEEWVTEPTDAESEFFVMEIRQAMAEAQLLGTYVPLRTDFQVVADALKDAARVIESVDHALNQDTAAEKLREIAKEMECKHDDC